MSLTNLDLEPSTAPPLHLMDTPVPEYRPINTLQPNRAVSFGPVPIMNTGGYSTHGYETPLYPMLGNATEPYSVRHSTPTSTSPHLAPSVTQTPAKSHYQFNQPITHSMAIGHGTSQQTSYGQSNIAGINTHSGISSQYYAPGTGGTTGVYPQPPAYHQHAYSNYNLAAPGPHSSGYAHPAGPPTGYPGLSGNPTAFAQQNAINPNPHYSHPRVMNKMIEPDTFDGTSNTEWSDYIVHFEQIADWNNWSDPQKAKMLTIKVRGEAQRFVGGLTMSQYNDYIILKYLLSQRFNPQEREVAYRCEFRNRRRIKGESPSDYGYALRRLGQKAFPSLPFAALEVQIIDQFISGLGSIEIQKHVQFHHPHTLESAINLAIEYTAVVGNLDRVTKPNLSVEEATPSVSQVQAESSESTASLRPLEFKPSFSLKDLEQTIGQIVTKQFEKMLAENQVKQSDPEPGSRNRERNPQNKRGGPPFRSGSPHPKRDSSPFRNYYDSGTRNIFCDYCKHTGHIESRCYKKQEDEARKAHALN